MVMIGIRVTRAVGWVSVLHCAQQIQGPVGGRRGHSDSWCDHSVLWGLWYGKNRRELKDWMKREGKESGKGMGKCSSWGWNGRPIGENGEMRGFVVGCL